MSIGMALIVAAFAFKVIRMPAIRVEKLSKSVPDAGRELTILNAVTFDIDDGETVAITGASGGAPLPVEVFERFKKITGISLRGGWGMTETAPAGTNLPYDGDAPAGTTWPERTLATPHSKVATIVAPVDAQ